MDESRSKRRLVRRLLLAALITSAGTQLQAIEPNTSAPFRDLLMEGWDSSSAESKLTFQGPQSVERSVPTLTAPIEAPQLRQINRVLSGPVETADKPNDFTKLLQHGSDQPHRLIKGKNVGAKTSFGKLASSITKPLSTEPQSVLMLESPQPEELTLPQTPTFKPTPRPPIAVLPETLPVVDPLPEVESAEPNELVRGAARRRGFGMLAIDQIGEPVLPGRPVQPELTLTQTIHANKLLELAREQLGEAADRMRRNATHSAKKLTRSGTSQRGHHERRSVGWQSSRQAT